MGLRWDVNRDGPGLPRDWGSGLGFHCINLVHLVEVVTVGCFNYALCLDLVYKLLLVQ